ncbi:hypothetical protein A3K86_19715 [Photobacterium jeanii]|uniref:OmpR/PhoB-type domain-containing protein n=1 Tax=Photobacterium jeanii TaxID=858640 RepID=A0A178K1K6_9GAMM|nr:winged helix-turn-helix domain-containing protein [Photobacterium jeanii]OAN11190.1 hypothetical protein A3K86_19715 [Photobacterium jeanii]PST90708.1 hypothetical protein C9I91_08815 [Photobacterium jeanii]
MWLLNPLKRSQLSNYEAGIHKKLKSTDCHILELLIKHEGKAVSKEEIMSTVWEGRIVSESSLTQSIAQLRLMLGDSGKEQRVIKTLPRKGYMILPHQVQLVPFKTENKIELESNNESDETSNEIIKITDNKEQEITQELELEVPTLKPPRDENHFLAHLRTSLRNNHMMLILFMFSVFIGISALNIYTYNLAMTHKTVSKKVWHTEQVNETNLHFKKGKRSRIIIAELKKENQSFRSNISDLFISTNPQQIYLSCIYISRKLNERFTLDFTLPLNYPFDQIKGLINEKCH